MTVVRVLVPAVAAAAAVWVVRRVAWATAEVLVDELTGKFDV